MRIGVLGIDTINETKSIIQNITKFASETNSVIEGLEWQTASSELKAEALENWIRSVSEKTLIKNKESFIKAIEAYDKVIVFGGSKKAVDVLSFAKVKLLFLPISILSDRSLGYDTALNEVVTNVLKVKDTISSLLYMKQRVCCVQLPGEDLSDLMRDAAAAVDGLVVTGGESVWMHTADYLREKDQKGVTYSFLIINESIQPKQLGAFLQQQMDLDFKDLLFDESQCMSSRPTAADRIIEKNLSQAVYEWLKNADDTKQLTIENKEVK
ncbi:6-phosphofructokinase [Metabacillus dongyingensis]|uniref:6-phosphofructokinase n=1 Tax=Metabacillus dongyingensis TaxID=2874282 RepID=UPI003B8C88C2